MNYFVSLDMIQCWFTGNPIIALSSPRETPSVSLTHKPKRDENGKQQGTVEAEDEDVQRIVRKVHSHGNISFESRKIGRGGVTSKSIKFTIFGQFYFSVLFVIFGEK